MATAPNPMNATVVPGETPGTTPPILQGGGTPDPSAQVAEMTKKLLATLAQASQRKQFSGTAQPSPVPGQQGAQAAQSIGMNTANPNAWGRQRFMAGLGSTIQNAVAKKKQQDTIKAENDWAYMQGALNELYAAQSSKDPNAIKQAQTKVDVVMGDPKKLKNMAKALNQDWLNPEKTTVYGEALKSFNAKKQQQETQQQQQAQQKQQAVQGLKGVFQKLLQRNQQPQLTDDQKKQMGAEVQAKAPTSAVGASKEQIQAELELLKEQSKDLEETKKEKSRALLEAQKAEETDKRQDAKDRAAEERQAARDKSSEDREDSRERSAEKRTQMQISAADRRAGGGSGGGLGAASSRDMSLVKGIYNYDLDPSKVTSLRGGERERVMGMVEEYAAQQGVPYDQTAYAGKQSTVKSFASGEGATAKRSLNQAIGHLESLRKAGEKLDNYKIPWINEAKNWIKTARGNEQVTNFDTRLNAVVDEMTRVFRNSGGTEEDIKQWRKTVNAAESPAQLKGAIDSMLDLMASRLNALSEQYKQGTRGPKDFNMLTDESRQILSKMGGSASKMIEADKNMKDTSGGGAGASAGGGFTKNPDGSYTEK